MGRPIPGLAPIDKAASISLIEFHQANEVGNKSINRDSIMSIPFYTKYIAFLVYMKFGNLFSYCF